MKNLALTLLLGLLMISAAPPSALSAEQPKITVKVLYDNYVFDDSCEPDWGYACLVTGTEKTILFDTGTKGELLFGNAKKLDCNLSDVQSVVISHNHGDHTGGLLPFLQRNGAASVYLPAATPEAFVKEVKENAAKVTVVAKPVKIGGDVLVLGPIGDRIVEQSLVVNTKKGLLLITGCSHPGIVTITKRAKEQLGRNVYMILGGTHLLRHSEEDVRQVIDELKTLGVEKVAVSHCSGKAAIALFKDAFGDGFIKTGVGFVLEIDAR